MRIKNAFWTPKVNKLIIYCDKCKKHFLHRSDKWKVTCPKCRQKESITKLRKEWLKRNGK